MYNITNTIKSVEQFQVEMPLVHPFRTSFGEENNKQAIIIKISDEDGNTGWGETCVSTNPGYCYETTETAWYIQNNFLLPSFNNFIKNKEIVSITDILDNWKPIRGHEFAKGGIEAALWALKSTQESISLGKIYGSTKQKIPTGVSIGIQSNIDKLINRISKFIDLGYHRIKIKIEPGWDIEPINRIRKEFGDIKLMVDANSAYSLSKNHLNILKELDKYDLMMIEQPLSYRDLLEHKKLQEIIDTPVCLDESIHSPSDAQLALEYGCCKIINIKPGRVGGFYNALEIANLAGKDKVWCGGMLESGIGRIHNLFLQANDNFNIPGDTSGSDRYFNQDIIEPSVTVDADGYVEIPKGIGLGYEVLEDQISKYTIRKSKFKINN